MKSPMNVFILLFFPSFFCSTNIQGQNFIWTKTFLEGNDGSNEGRVICDSKQNIYFHGSFFNSSPVFKWTKYIKKYTSEGKEIWTYNLEEGNYDYSIAIDNNDNIYILIDGILIDDNYKNILRKLNSNRLLLWEKNIESTYEGTVVNSIALDKNDVLLAGRAGVGVNEGGAWISKWDSSGNEKWQNTFSYGEWNTIYVRSSSIDLNGNFYIAGSVGWTLEDIFFAKFNNEGNILWDKRIDGSTAQHDEGWRIANDLDGNVVVFGFVDKPWVGYDRTCWVGKFDSIGNNIWTNTYFRANSILTEGLALDKDNNIYIAGSYYDGIGGYKPFLNKYDKDGSNLWMMKSGFYARFNSIDIDAFNNIYFAGDSIDYFWIGKYGEVTSNVHDQSHTQYFLLQNYPNPFNLTTTIEYSLPKTCYVSITILDLLGREISKLVNEEKQIGNYEVKFDGTNLPGGIYLCHMKAGEFIHTSQLILMK